VLRAEHRCYPLALRLIAAGRVRVDGARVIVEGAGAPGAILLNPDDGRG
jgi:phosphoribosylglycinamide formyltransferase-1